MYTKGFSNLLIFGFIDLIEAKANNIVIFASIKSINPKINKSKNPGNPFNPYNPELSPFTSAAFSCRRSKTMISFSPFFSQGAGQ